MKKELFNKYKYQAIALILGIFIALFSVGLTYSLTDIKTTDVLFNVENMNEEEVIYKLLDNIAMEGNNYNQVVSFDLPELVIEEQEIVIASKDEKEDPNNVVNVNKGEAKEINVTEAQERYETNETSLGIDVSTWNGNIDWKEVRKSGITFAMIRVGFRGYESGQIMMDNKFYDNIKGAISNNINVGVYFFSGAIDEAEAVEEAEWVLNVIKDYDISYPIAYDVEIFGNREDTRLHGITDKKITDITMAFINRIKSTSYTPMIYSYLNAFNNRFEVGRFGNTRVWLAHYADKTTYKGNYHMWQYTSSGEVPGIKGRVDMNVSYFSVTNDISKRQDIVGINSDSLESNVEFIDIDMNTKMLNSAVIRTTPSLDVPNKAGEIKKGKKIKVTGISDTFVRIEYDGYIYYIENINDIELPAVSWSEVNINKRIKLLKSVKLLTRPYFFLKECEELDYDGELDLIAKNNDYLKVSYNDKIYYIHYDDSTYEEVIETPVEEEIVEEENTEEDV